MPGTDVNILFGGSSSERRVSVASAQHVSAVLDEAAAWFLAPTGAVHIVGRDELARFEKPFERDFSPSAPAAFPTLVAAVETQPSRVWFLALHGGEGEDGTIQRMLEMRNIAFTGPGADASARAFDKEVAKEVAANAGVRIAKSVHLSKDPKVMREALRDLLSIYGRLVAKPVAGGSSVGLFFVGSPAEAERVAREIEEAEEPYLAEEFVSGPELTVGVVDGTAGPRALPPSEVRLEAGRAFDYEGKYLGKGTQEITPAEVAPEVTRAAQELALAAHAALGCEGYSRTDVIVSPSGPVFLELNTLPGLTRRSFIPQQLAVEGTSMLSFLEGQIALARRRRDRA
ncbi:MAG TPA: ATP-grasp domain-containing protein [Myxococcales bacterium]|nr:ATP-grasp domain-containing protein [Myxococcales bacterium]